MTSRYEGLPMTLLEAKSYQLPIVSFDCQTGPRDIIQDGINGYLIEGYNIDLMIEKISKLIENKELRYNLSLESQKDKNKFEINTVLDEWINLLERY